MYCTGPCSAPVDSLPPRSAFVDADCWENYYGPYAARAWFLTRNRPPDANNGTRSQLEAVEGLGSKRATAIIEARGKYRSFWSNALECQEDTKVPVRILTRL